MLVTNEWRSRQPCRRPLLPIVLSGWDYSLEIRSQPGGLPESSRGSHPAVREETPGSESIRFCPPEGCQNPTLDENQQVLRIVFDALFLREPLSIAMMLLRSFEVIGD